MKLTDIIHQIGDRVRLASRVTALTGGTSAVDSIIVTAGGTGYTSAPAVSFSGGGGGSGAAATAIIFDGAVIGVTVTAAGTGYTSAPSVIFTGGGGSAAAATAQILALDLDAIPTLNISLTQSLWVSPIVSGVLFLYRLKSGTDAESSPFIIRPDDYAGTTNEKVWELVALERSRDVLPLRTVTYAGSTNIDLNAGQRQSVALTGDVTFTTSNRGDGKKVLLRIVSDGSLRNFTFPSWVFVGGTAPASIAANKTALLTLDAFGSNDTDIAATYVVQP